VIALGYLLFTVSDLIDEMNVGDSRGLLIAIKILIGLCVISSCLLIFLISEDSVVIENDASQGSSSGIVELKVTTTVRATPADFAKVLRDPSNQQDLYTVKSNQPDNFVMKQIDDSNFRIGCGNTCYDLHITAELGHMKVSKYCMADMSNKRAREYPDVVELQILKNMVHSKCKNPFA